MKKVFFNILLLLFCTAKVVAQSDSQISQYTLFLSAFNPAAAGETGMVQVAGIHRMDFLTVENGVQTTNFGVNMPFTLGKSSHGGGIRFINKVQGTFWAYQNAYLQYAYKWQTPVGRFSVGFDFGFINSRIDGSKAMPKTPSDEEFNSDDDPVILGDVSGMKMDFNIGALYSFKNGYVGVSGTHVTAPKLLLDEYRADSVLRTMYVVGAYEYKVPDTKLTIKPQTLFKTDFVFFDWHLGAVLDYDEKFWGGLSYRIGNTVGITVGFNIMEGLSAGLVYDLPVTQMINTAGSVELILEYNFEFILNKHTKKYKSIRIL